MNGTRGEVETVKMESVSNRYELVAPPAHIEMFSGVASKNEKRWINYEAHPAYGEYISLVAIPERIRSTLVFLKYFLLVLCKRVVAYELIPAHVRRTRTLRSMFSALMINLKRAVRSRRCDAGESNGGLADQIRIALKQQGVCVVVIPPEAFAKVSGILAPEIDRLRAARAKKGQESRAFIDSRATVLRPENPGLFAVMDTVFRESGVYEAVSVLTGRDAGLVDINPQLNDDSDDFWRRTFPDLDMSQNRTAYFHRDASGGDIKAIVYLSDVEKENGPFSFVIGSQKGRPRGLADWVSETNDHSGFSATNSGARRSFAALPGHLRRKCAFGNDVTDESEISERLLAAEWQIIAPRGRMVIFDTKGIHRGGMVTRGERAVVTCILG